MNYICRSCHQVFTKLQLPLEHIRNLPRRFQPGTMVPDGLCPSCTGFVHAEGRFATPQEIDCARAMYQSSDLQIDNDATTSHAEEHIWVQAWVYVPSHLLR